MSTKEELFKKIDELKISPLDYNTLLKMLDSMSPEMFARCMEEIVNGNLMISDFTELISHTNYEEFLEKSLSQQYKLAERIHQFNSLANYVAPETINNANFFTTTLGIDRVYLNELLELIPDNDITKKNMIEEFYNTEIDELKKDLIYSLSIENKQDNILQIACKNLILQELLSQQDPDSKVDPLEMASLLFSINEFILPISYEDQPITEADKYFMRENNVDEHTMKKMKALAMFLRRETLKDNISRIRGE